MFRLTSHFIQKTINKSYTHLKETITLSNSINKNLKRKYRFRKLSFMLYNIFLFSLNTVSLRLFLKKNNQNSIY